MKDLLEWLHDVHDRLFDPPPGLANPQPVERMRLALAFLVDRVGSWPLARESVVA
ncbi:hypothetical protein [Halomonas heilongjiangensis]|uniref:hypothetical protein n=1 Tax=Halomonas heilongjiangensis TaxID=1387883 RepID=UPI0014766205|nr:hypothetical protein [Halomonas heilongjiangensis]